LRFGLPEALKHVVERSGALVKVFATTRVDPDILLQFEVFPRIELDLDDNVDDINQFVGITIEIRWCPAQKGFPGDEKADGWAGLAAEGRDARGVEAPMPLPRSLAHLKRGIS